MNLICLSNIPWNQNYPRTKFILSEFAQQYVTYYVEECVFNDQEDGYNLSKTKEKVLLISPHLEDKNHTEINKNARISRVIKDLFNEEAIRDYIFWYYTPMAFAFTRGLKPKLSIYDCIDEKNNFNFIDHQAKTLKQELLGKADIVFEGNQTDEFINDKTWDLTFLEMKKIIKKRLEGEEMKKIIRLPRLSDKPDFKQTESFGN
jgi:UDP-galactopyranose mutase